MIPRRAILRSVTLLPAGILPCVRAQQQDPLEVLSANQELLRGVDVEPRCREALTAGDAKALAAWKSLSATAAWLEANSEMFAHPPDPTITALAAPGFSFEIVNLLFRRNAAPAIAPANTVPDPAPERILALVAAALPALPGKALDHARAGAVVVTDAKLDSSRWKMSKEEPDRVTYSLGRGHVVAYRKRIADPSEFALDVIDLITHRRRSCRLWNALAAIPRATIPAQGEFLLSVVNYGSADSGEVQARVQGRYKRATLLRPEGPPVDLKVFGRGTMTEVFLPSLARVAVVRFSGA